MVKYPSPVLLLEDDDIMRRALVRVWTSEGVEVLEARTLADAERVIREHGSRLQGAIIDFILPDGLGSDIFRRIKVLGLENLPCVFITALPDFPFEEFSGHVPTLIKKPLQDTFEPLKSLQS